MSAQEVVREIALQEHLEQHGAERELDIQHLRDTQLILSGIRCRRIGNTWLTSTPIHHPMDDWANKVMRVLVGKRGDSEFDRLDTLRQAIDGQPSASSARHKWILHVGIDLSLPVEEQLDRLQPHLVEARTYLYRFTGKGAPRKQKPTAWRDIYAFVLRYFLGRSVADIAQEMFPHEYRTSRDTKVRMAIARVRPFARSIGFLSAASRPSK